MPLCSRVANSVFGPLKSHAISATKRVIKNGHGNARCCYASTCSGAGTELVFLLPSEEATHDLAATFCASRRKGDAYLIHGTLGAGKSAFCRAYIRFACGDDELPVPSPTYLLLNTYEDEVIDGPPIHHLDLYRLSKASSELRLDIPSLLATGSALFEWPDRLRTAPDRHVEMHMYPLRPVTSENLCNQNRSWLTGVSASRAEGNQDVRWRLMCVRGVGLPLIRRYMEGRNAIEELGTQPEYIEVPQPDARELLSDVK